MYLLESVFDVRIASEEGVTVVRVPIGTDEYVLGRVMGVVNNESGPANMPNRQAAALIAIECLGPRKKYIERALDTGLCTAKHADSRQQGAVGVTENPGAIGRGQETVVFSRKGVRIAIG